MKLWLLTPGNAGPFVPTESRSCLLPERAGACCWEERGHRTWTELVKSKKWLSHHSSACALAFFFFPSSLFHLFLAEGETLEMLLQKESLESGKCVWPSVCRQWGLERQMVVVGGYQDSKVDFWQQKTSAALLQNNPCVCELKVLKIKGKFIILLNLTDTLF